MRRLRRHMFWIVLAPFFLTIGQMIFYSLLRQINECNPNMVPLGPCGFWGFDFAPAMRDFWIDLNFTTSMLVGWLLFGIFISWILALMTKKKKRGG